MTAASDIQGEPANSVDGQIGCRPPEDGLPPHQGIAGTASQPSIGHTEQRKREPQIGQREGDAVSADPGLPNHSHLDEVPVNLGRPLGRELAGCWEVAEKSRAREPVSCRTMLIFPGEVRGERKF